MARGEARLTDERLPGARLWALGTYAIRLAVVLAIASALFAWTPGALLALGAVAIALATHLAVGIRGYRSVMRRPWPQVRPLADDDDDW